MSHTHWDVRGERGFGRRGSRVTDRRKLIEVALPLDAINRESAREKSIRHGHPSTLHLWWARRPLAACRAVLFAQLVDDPSARPDEFPTAEACKSTRPEPFGTSTRSCGRSSLTSSRPWGRRSSCESKSMPRIRRGSTTASFVTSPRTPAPCGSTVIAVSPTRSAYVCRVSRGWLPRGPTRSAARGRAAGHSIGVRVDWLAEPSRLGRVATGVGKLRYRACQVTTRSALSLRLRSDGSDPTRLRRPPGARPARQSPL